MASKVVELVTPLIQQSAEKIGLDLVDIEYVKKPNGYNLTVFIDKKGGVCIEDCESLHNMINEPLDELDPTNGTSYILNVSSCGADRPLKTLKDYLRNVGKNVEVKFYSPYKGSKSHCGIIIDANEDFLIIDENKQNVEIEINKIAVVTPILEL